ncbi:MAG: hypothetical protein JWQ50_4926 [Caballeronia mineralivorans]|jgi:AraC-like DNA-binding protein|nr:hypothetical protein [Caballeronia mineralivorans]
MQQSPPMRWSTSDVAPAHGFDYWRESICAAFDPMSPELAVDQRSSFCGDITAWNIGEACLMKIHASGHVTGRSPQDIAHGSHDYVFLYRQMAAAWFDLGDGTSFVTHPGTVVIGHADRVFSTGATAGHEFRHCVLKLPRRLFEPMLPHSDDIVTTVISGGRGIGALLASYFDAFIDHAPDLHPDEARMALHSLASLSASAYGRLAPDYDLRDALLRARLQQATQVIERCVDPSALSPAFVARHLGISVRALHRLFEPTGLSFSHRVQLHRLDLARRRLVSRLCREQTVLQIALDCGFSSLATFYRAFSEAYGTSPAAYRAGSHVPFAPDVARNEKDDGAER